MTDTPEIIKPDFGDQRGEAVATGPGLDGWLNILGVAILAGAGVMAARMVWEQTVWTWERGPQMVGFSLAHGSGAFLFMFPVLLVVWLPLALYWTIRSLLKKQGVGIGRWMMMASAVLLLVILSLPKQIWERLFIERMAASPHAVELLQFAAVDGDLKTVRAFVAHGVPVNAANPGDWRTALHGAALSGDLATVRYLVAAGANVNVLDRAGDSPLELAAANQRYQAAAFLTANGAKRIRGDDAQHQKAASDEVRENEAESPR
ncbi:MAG TPA: ankyrin repeat domain-containing protein [Candidatus Acidoferrales bacterium]